MAERELANKLASGEITSMKIAGTGSDRIVQVAADVQPLIDGKGVEEVLEFVPQTVDPTYKESQMYYKDGTTNIQGAYPDVTLQVGREIHLEIVNNSGATIANGKACRHNGVVGGMVQIELALADTFNNSRILGVTTHEILNGNTGILTTFGMVGDVDTSSFATGVPLYLSETVPGDFVENAPDIISQVGGSLVQSATVGSIFVSLENNINLPTAIASQDGQASNSYVMAAGVPETVTEYIEEITHYSTASTFTGVSTLIHTGDYGVLITAGGTITDEEVDVTFELYNITSASIVKTFTFNSGRGANPALVPFSKTFSSVFKSTVAFSDYALRMISATNETINLTQISFDLESKKLE